jgi:exopolysaccharide production protein ExoQ
MTQPVSKARMLRELILGNSLFIWMLIAIVAIATLLLFQLASRKKIGFALEKTFAGFYIFISPFLTQPPFNYLHFTNLQDTKGSILSMLPYFFYPWVVLILFSRFKAFGSKFIDFFAKVLMHESFLFTLYITAITVYIMVSSS